MKTPKPLILLALFLLGTLTFAQESAEIKELMELPKAQSVSFPKKVNQWSTYSIIGSTQKYLVVTETVHISAKSSYQYSFEHHQLLHFFDKTNPKNLVFSQQVWSQTRSEHAGKASKGLNKHHEDEVPNYRIVGDKIFSLNPHYTKFHSDIKGMWASVMRSYTIEGNRLKQKSIKIHTKQTLKVHSTFEVNTDSGFLIVSSPGLLTKDEKKEYKFCVNYYDLDMSLKYHVPLSFFPKNVFTFSDKLVQFYVSKQTKNEQAHYVGLAIDLNTGERFEQNLYKIARGTSYDYHPDWRTAHFLERHENTMKFAIHIKEDDKKISSLLSTWDFEPGATFTTTEGELVLKRLEDTDDGEQEDHQVKYFEFLNSIDVFSSKSDIRKEISVQRLNDVQTYSWQISDYYEGKYYTIGFPMLIYCMHNGTQQLVVLDRFMYSSDYSNMLDIGVPYFLGKTDDILMFIAPFAEPEIQKKDVKYSKKANQVYQLIEIDLTTHEVIRYNVIGEFGDDDKTGFVNTHPTKLIRLNGKLYFISPSSDADKKTFSLSYFEFE